jgi:transketolase
LHTFGVFLTRRPYDQVAMALAVPRLPVRLLGFLPGLTTPGGVTHQAIDDVGLMRLLPGMTVVELGDATDVETFYDAVEAVPGPVYVRMLRGELPRLFSRDDPFVLGRCRVLAEGEDWLVLTSGICTEQALAVLPLARARGLDAGHIHVGTLKPFHDEILLDALHRARKGVVVMENHGVEGGLGSAVAACMAEAGMGKPLVRLGLRDVWALGASRAWLAARFGIDGDALLGTLEKLSGLSLREA